MTMLIFGWVIPLLLIMILMIMSILVKLHCVYDDILANNKRIKKIEARENYIIWWLIKDGKWER